MAQQLEYKCHRCGYEYISIDKIFWIDEDINIEVAPLSFLTSQVSSEALVKGYFGEYYCYNCNKFVNKFIIHDKVPEIYFDEVIKLIESYNDLSKVIEFDNKFQRCLECGKELFSKSHHSFALDVNDEFIIEDVFHDFYNDEKYKFWGEYYGYFCQDCKKQFNKFIIVNNNANLSEDEIKAIINEHTNDLTIFIKRDLDLCPDCGDQLYYLHSGSKCPQCREDILILTNEIILD